MLKKRIFNFKKIDFLKFFSVSIFLLSCFFACTTTTFTEDQKPKLSPTTEIQLSSGQVIEYFGEGFKRVTNKSEAEYYRVITYDENGRPVGKVKDYYITGEIQWEGKISYVDKNDDSKDIYEGLSTAYYKNGQIEEKGTYVDGKPHGEVVAYYKNGQIEEKGNYVDGKRNGDVVGYYKNGQIKKKGTYVDGKIEYLNYHENGEIEQKRNYVDGKLNGECVTYDENGKISEKTNYLDGKYHGEIIKYYENGQISFKGNHVNGQLNGEIIKYYENGQIKGKVNYVNGKRHGEYVAYHKNGQIEHKGNYVNGKPHGEVVLYHENGKYKAQSIFKDGKNITKWFISCDEFERCQNVFNENFKNNDNNWQIGDLSNYSSKITGNGLLVEHEYSQQKGYLNAQIIHLPFDQTKEFTIEALVKFKNGSGSKQYGIVYGFRDWDNYNAFWINANGEFAIDCKIKGLSIETNQFKASDHINVYGENKIKIFKVASGKVYYSVNGKLVYTGKSLGFSGNYLGFGFSDRVDLLCKNIRVEVSEPEIDPNSIGKQPIIVSEWKGNGSGVIIS